MAGAATAEDPPLGVGRLLTFRDKTTTNRTHEEGLDSHTAPLPCAVHVHVQVQPHDVTHSFIHLFKCVTHAQCAAQAL